MAHRPALRAGWLPRRPNGLLRGLGRFRRKSLDRYPDFWSVFAQIRERRAGLMPRRTPLEVFINAQTDRQAAYEKRRRDAGFTKTCVWVPLEDVAEFKEMARQRVAAKEALQGETAAIEGGSAPVR